MGSYTIQILTLLSLDNLQTIYIRRYTWRSRPDIFQKGIGDIEVDVRISKLWQEVEQLKKDMKQVVKELAKIDQKLHLKNDIKARNLMQYLD